MEQAQYILMFLSGLGCFLIGFKIISQNIENLAGKLLKKLFQKTGKNKLVGVGIGVGATAVIQSSTATTVMVVGFVNAGLMTLAQATPIIMGANIGTTVTALLMSLSGGSGLTSYIFISFIAVGGFINLFGGKHEKVKGWGMVCAGLGLMFLGMNLCQSNMMNFINSNESIKNFIVSITNPFLLMLLGLILTAVVHSSAAVTVLVMTLQSALGTTGLAGNSVLFLVLGTNIGTCVTAMFSSIGTSTSAKRASVIHLLFNLLGSLIFLVFLLLYRGFYEDVLLALFGTSELAIAMFHFFFNLICASIFLPFSNIFVKISTLIIKDKEEEKEQSFLDSRLVTNGAIALSQVKKELLRMGDVYMSSLRMAFDAFINKDDDKNVEIHELIKKGSLINQSIVDYIVKIPNDALNKELDFKVQATYRDLADLDRIGEIADNLTKHTHKTVQDDLVFSDVVKVDLEKMVKKIEEQYTSMKNYLTTKEPIYFIQSEDNEEEIDKMRSSLVAEHLERLKEGKCNPSSSGIFINLVGNLERAGDHITFVSERYHTTKKD